MTNSPTNQTANDDQIDDTIYTCLRPDNPNSFFLYAGAGSGKTSSLVNVLDRFRLEHGKSLWLRGQHIAVITYTNAACDEIKRRIAFDPIVDVSTIHSFAWSLIGSCHIDIRAWLSRSLPLEIAELQAEEAKGRAGAKAARDRQSKIAGKKNRLVNLDTIRRFVYSPTGDNRGRDALNHSEVISITSGLMTSKPTLQKVLVNRYPVLLIDESQDTNQHLMDAFFLVQQQHNDHFCLGLFGDTMQRIYGDGKVALHECIPNSWLRPAKEMNHRCPHRIIKLINRIRSDVDDQRQTGRNDNPEGFVRLFILPGNLLHKNQVEVTIAKRMADITSDPLWAAEPAEYKTLVLEHQLAATRLGFEGFFGPLYAVEHFRTGLLDGTLPSVRFFANDILPLVEALKCGDRFAAAAIVRQRSPLLDKSTLRSAADGEQLQRLSQAKVAADALGALWANQTTPRFLDVLKCVSDSGLFPVPEILQPIVAREQESASVGPSVNDEGNTDEALVAWDEVMKITFDQIKLYDRYVTGQSPFTTHQGVKGLEFPRVMVIIDDQAAKGFMFSYEKLFGAKDKSQSDTKNERLGADTTIDRTRRLFYVTCSRAQSSLAIVAYSSDPAKVRTQVTAEGWFTDDEVEIIA